MCRPLNDWLLQDFVAVKQSVSIVLTFTCGLPKRLVNDQWISVDGRDSIHLQMYCLHMDES